MDNFESLNRKVESLVNSVNKLLKETSDRDKEYRYLVDTMITYLDAIKSGDRIEKPVLYMMLEDSVRRYHKI